MTRPEDSFLTPGQLANVQRHADRFLRDAAAHGRFPTPIKDLIAAAKLTIVDDEVLNESLLRRFVEKAKASVATIKSALSKVLGLFEANERLIVIDKGIPNPRVPFVTLHEAGHGTMPHQSKMYALIHDCEKTLDPDITDLFEREANVFASEVLFQGDVFSEHANNLTFGVKTAIALSRKFGGSNYAGFRRYVTTSVHTCCLVVLESPVFDDEGGFRVDVRRVIASISFDLRFDAAALAAPITRQHPLATVVPTAGRRMVYPRTLRLVDRNGDNRECIGESFDTKHQILVLIRDTNVLSKAAIVVPSTRGLLSATNAVMRSGRMPSPQ